jgi:hypothetical protein
MKYYFFWTGFSSLQLADHYFDTKKHDLLVYSPYSLRRGRDSPTVVGTGFSSLQLADHYFDTKKHDLLVYSPYSLRRGRDSNPRYPVEGTLAFQASPFDHSGTSPNERKDRLNSGLFQLGIFSN